MTAQAPPAAPQTSVSNALFLVGFGMFLTVAVLPALLSALVRTLMLLALLLCVCVAMNPTDHSFACWVSEQEDIDLRLKKEKPGVKQWFSAVVKTAIAIVTQEPLTWTFHSVLAFSVVYVPSLNRYAFGCLGSWWWADKNPRLLPLCKAEWISRFTRGGVPSGIERYMEEDSPEQRRAMNSRSGRRPVSRSGSSADSLRQRKAVAEFEEAATAFASSINDVADSIQSAFGGSSQASSASSTATGSSDRALRASAIKAKINKDWRQAAALFQEASRAALSMLSRTNYQLEAAWCEVEDAESFPDRTSKLVKLVEDVSEELASTGYFDDAARSLAEFALRLKKKFPQDARGEVLATQLGDYYVRAQRIAVAGNSSRMAADYAVRAAAVYAEASLWQRAEECFEAAAKLQLLDSRPEIANESFGSAVLCRVGQLDVTGADQLAQVYRRLQANGKGMKEDSDLDTLLESVFKAHDKWSVALLETAIKRYESRKRLGPWQAKCLENVHNKIGNSDLR